ncbi:MAG: hypothetical protein A3A80_00760 [Candidatus Terrybacteria bacterium RIFCSPLOWO2_01_FULL_44_24]|nr:MAG: hypothetical protein A3A80_00760 [Candidatus Terrybacteria bacterium RIFCSPLOWO2_01_FULL_44_24]
MQWLYFALAGYALLAFVAIGDRLLLASSTVKPARYVFLIGIMGGAVSGLIFLAHKLLPAASFLNFLLPENALYVFGSALAAGGFYALALLSYFSVLNKVEASRVVPTIGAFIPIFSFVFSVIFLGDWLNLLQMIAFSMLVAGSFLLTLELGSMKAFYLRNIPILLLSSLIFSIYYLLSKSVYKTLPFWQSIALIQLGLFLAAVIISLVFRGASQNKEGTLLTFSPKQFFVFVNEFFGAISIGLIQYAIYLGSVVLVNALQGVQYAVLFISLILLRPFFGKLLAEKWSFGIVIQKFIGIMLIIAGIVLISFAANHAT